MEVIDHPHSGFKICDPSVVLFIILTIHDSINGQRVKMSADSAAWRNTDDDE